MLGKNDPMGRPCSGEVPKMSLGLAGGPLNVAERPKDDHLSENPLSEGRKCSLVVRFRARRVTSSSVRSLARASSAVRRFLKFGCSSPFNSSTVASESPGSESVSH